MCLVFLRCFLLLPPCFLFGCVSSTLGVFLCFFMYSLYCFKPNIAPLLASEAFARHFVHLPVLLLVGGGAVGDGLAA